MLQNEYKSIDCFSLRPNKLVMYKQYYLSNYNGKEKVVEPKPRNKSNNFGAFIDGNYVAFSKFHNFEISKAATNNIKEKINWLFQLAKKKNVTTNSGKSIYNFKINFLTLTLPSKQVHPTAEITKECLNQFFVEVAKKYNFTNYVWRLEFQNNGNVHYHIATDVFIDYFVARTIWNRILRKKNYVQAYTEKMEKMNFFEYAKEYGNAGKIDHKTLSERYAKGKKTNWKQPNTVDTKVVTGKGSIAFYMAKYFNKKEKSKCSKNELDNEENAKGLRLWFCSRSLSKLKKIQDFQDAIDFDLFDIVSKIPRCFKVFHEYCQVVYFDLKLAFWENKKILDNLFYLYAKEKDYIAN